MLGRRGAGASLWRRSLARLWLNRRAGRVQSRATNSADSLRDSTVTLGWEDSMRSIRLLTATTVILAGAWACGGDGGGDTGATDDPSAAFTPPACVAGSPCTFTDASSDPQGAGTITTRVWDFGDRTGPVTATGVTQDHTFQAAGSFGVKLTVTDNTGKSDDVTNQVTVTAPVSPPP